MQKRILAFLLLSGLILGLTVGAVPVLAETSEKAEYELGNSASALLAGGEIATYGDRIYAAADEGIGCYEGGSDEMTILTDERGSSLNVFDGELWYAAGSSVRRMDLIEGGIETVVEWDSEIDELAVVNGEEVYFLADGAVWYVGDDGEAVAVVNGDISGFIPTKYGILTQGGDLFNRSIFADGMFVTSGVYSWNVDGDRLLISADGTDYAQDLADVFDEGETATAFTVYSAGTV